jgi:hypothetical protein
MEFAAAQTYVTRTPTGYVVINVSRFARIEFTPAEARRMAAIMLRNASALDGRPIPSMDALMRDEGFVFSQE